MMEHACGPYFGPVRKTETEDRCPDEPRLGCFTADASCELKRKGQRYHVGTGSRSRKDSVQVSRAGTGSWDFTLSYITDGDAD